MAESPSRAAAKPKAKKVSTGPKTTDMVVEAIAALNDRKGASVPAIKKYIVEKYAADPSMLKHRLKKALETGIESGRIVRPKGAEETGASLNGRFKIDKAKLQAEEKAKQKKLKEKEKPKKAVKPKARAPPALARQTPKKAAKKSEKRKSITKAVTKVDKVKKSPKKQPKKVEKSPKKPAEKKPKKPAAKKTKSPKA